MQCFHDYRRFCPKVSEHGLGLLQPKVHLMYDPVQHLSSDLGELPS